MKTISTVNIVINSFPARILAARRATFFVVLAISALTYGIGAARADYNNPTNSEDCNLWSGRYEFSARLDRINARERQCSDQNGLKLRWVSSASCGYFTPESCVPIARQACDLRDQMRVLRDMCMARLETYRAKEQARRLAEEQAERERNQFLKETAKRSVTPGGIDPGLKPTQDVLKGISQGRRLAQRMTGANLANAGSLHLSSALTAIGMKRMQAIQTEALERFRDSMAQLQRNNPGLEIGNFRAPDPGRREAISRHIQELDAIERQLAHAVTMADRGLPLGGASAVEGEEAERLTEIATAMANGELRTPLFETPVEEAIVAIERRRQIERDREARSRASADVFDGVDQASLQQTRKGKLAEIRQRIARERERIVEEERRQKNLVSGYGVSRNLSEEELAIRRRELAANRIHSGYTETSAPVKSPAQNNNKPAGSCAHVYYVGPHSAINYQLVNKCNYFIRAECPSSHIDGKRSIRRGLHPGGGFVCRVRITDIYTDINYHNID